ncbi:MAG: LacI family DNA-binding transcriptional regulator [Clostridiales bacterium]|nr:LacI family DNA-binding transcriptional regulator [Clostridiales bacterium]
MGTLKDLSQLTGYSIATISRVLNEDKSLSVTENTRKIILEAAGKLDYTGKKGQSKKAKAAPPKIGIVEMMDIHNQLEDPYYLYLKRNVESCCFESGLETIALQYDEDQGCYRSIVQTELDGILAIGQFLEEQIEAMRQWTDKIVFVDSSPFEQIYSAVTPNFSLGVSQGIEYLAEMGHEKIAFVGPEFSTDSMGREAPEKRRKFFEEYIQSYRTDLKGVFLDTVWRSNDVSERVEKYLKETTDRVTAFFAFNEATAIGIIRALKAQGYQVPDDYSVLSYNDTSLATLLQPQLTSISIHLHDMAKAAVELMGKQLKGAGSVPVKILISSTLIKRESVRRLK